MALRVARGLFRLWLILSVLWIGYVGYVTWQTFPVDNWYIPEILLSHDYDYLLPGYCSPAQDDAEIAKQCIDQQIAAGKRDRRIVDKLAKARREWIIQVASIQAPVLALVPPAFVLALG